MNQLGAYASQYLVAALAFVAIDVVWLGTIAASLYKRHLGDLLAEEPNMAAAVAFYALFLSGLVYFVIHPAIADGSWMRALFAGAFFGLVTYATFDLTNLAVLRGWPFSIVPIDMAWGTFLAGSVSLVTYLVAQLIPVLR
jgi:uncharacterized membrane protein